MQRADGPAGTTAEVCGGCHRAIHQAWKRSSHAQSMESRVFQDALAMAESDFGAEGRRTCLGCHAPLAAQTGDGALTRKVSWEGVTCDYCHSVRDVVVKPGGARASVALGAVKTGPLKDAAAGAHQTAYSAVHKSYLICASCHEYRNAAGFPVLTTVTEWKNSRHSKEGRECQSCHMGKVAGDVVDPRLQRSREGGINLHEMPGSRSLPQLTKAIKAQLSTVREGDELQVVVRVANHAAGHSFPTGSPMREMLLEVRADGGGQSFKGERVYARRVADKSGTPVKFEHVAFLRGVKELSDTRLAAGETRTEVFKFPLAKGPRTQVKATFWYYYSPMSRAESQNKIAFLSLTQAAQ